jgi:mannose-6-phosphate isomerase
MSGVHLLKGIHRHYDWGGTQFIPNIFDINNLEHTPYAEYWMGAHESAPAMITTEEGDIDLIQFIVNNPEKHLGAKTIQAFSTLPYLLKILDVAKMLSIQVHPSIQSAIKGFALEQNAGIAINAPNRNYKDQNHKPEVMVALSDFWLLHGFLPEDELKTALQQYPTLNSFLSVFEKGSYQLLYQTFMELPQDQVDSILIPLVNQAIESVASGSVNKSQPEWWVNKYYQGIAPKDNIDKGIFSIYIMNIMFVTKYQAVYQGAGILHAYLEGQNIELMANSDNVLRGGLTTKHVDVPELLQHIDFVPTVPKSIDPVTINEFETQFPCPIQDFGLSKITVSEGKTYTIQTDSLEILLVMEGEVQIDQLGPIHAGGSVLILPNKEVTINASKPSVLFRAYVP